MQTRICLSGLLYKLFRIRVKDIPLQVLGLRLCWAGKGVAYTNLRPSGKIMIDDGIYDAFTRGNYIPKDAVIEVISEEGTSLKVKEIPAE